MKLYVHHFLRNNSKDVTTGYPLNLVVHEQRVVETPFKRENTLHLLANLNWEVLLLAAESCGFNNLPAELTDEIVNEEGFCEAMHRVLFDVDIVEGELICPETGKVFPIHNGIPDMMYVCVCFYVSMFLRFYVSTFLCFYVYDYFIGFRKQKL